MDTPLVLELLAAFGLPLGWGVWQWLSIRRERAQDRQRDDRATARKLPAD